MSKSQAAVGCEALATQVLYKLISWHNQRNVSAMYSPYAILEFGMEPTVPHPRTPSSKFWVPRFNDLVSKLKHRLQHSIEHVVNCA
jgi:hypothetical protein